MAHRSLLAAVVTAGLLGPAVAHAASPIVLGDGQRPGITVNGDTAYVTWLGNESLNRSLHFCRLPVGASSCQVTTTIPVPSDSDTVDRAFTTFIIDAAFNVTGVAVLNHRYGADVPGFKAVYSFVSHNDGASFDRGTPVGTIPFNDAVKGPGNGVSLITESYQNGTVYQWVPLDGGQTMTENVLSPDHPYDGSVVLHGIDNKPFAVFANGSGEAQFREVIASHPTGSDALNPANWTPAQTYATDQRYMRLADQVTGLFVASLSNGGLEVRKWNGSAFGSPVRIPGDTRPVAGNAWDFVEPSSGRLHLVWSRFGSSDGHDTIGYAASRDGVHWGVRHLAGGTDTPFNLRLGMSFSANTGLAVADTGSPHRILGIPITPWGRCGLPYVGTAGDDTLIGDSSGGDRISGLGGDDIINGEGQRDCLSGGSGNDTIVGGDDKDQITAGSGKDRVNAGGGNDRINVRDGELDKVRCGGGTDRVRADHKDDLMSDCENVKFK